MRDAHRVRADRAEADLEAARAENRRLAEQLAQSTEVGTEPPGLPSPRPGAAGRTKKTPPTGAPRPEV